LTCKLGRHVYDKDNIGFGGGVVDFWCGRCGKKFDSKFLDDSGVVPEVRELLAMFGGDSDD